MKTTERIGGGRRRRVAWTILTSLTLLGWTAWETCGLRGCPDPRSLSEFLPGGAPVLLDRNGNTFAEMHPWAIRVTPLDALPPYLAAAFVSTEDRRFYRHGGVDWVRVLGAGRANAAAGEVREGASTITMQVARTLFPERIPAAERTLARKAIEVRVAGLIEDEFTKDEILELYVNHIYVGAGLHGVEAGALHYFGRSAEELTLEEAALLAGLVRAPAALDPRRNPSAALDRRNLVLRLMERDGHIDRDEAERASRRPLGVVATPPPRAPRPTASYFAAAVLDFLEAELGPDRLEDPLRVFTTLDPVLQRVATEEMERQLAAIESGQYGSFDPASPVRVGPGAGGDAAVALPPELQGAVVFLSPETGDILALVGGRDFRTSPFNRATNGRRQMGSAFKPIVYAAALERGYVASQPLSDRPFTLEEEGGVPWSPRNYDGDFRGKVSMRRALVESLNVPTARLAMAVGMDRVSKTARDLGLDDVPEFPAAALGTATASPLELAVAYGALARGGSLASARSVIRVETMRGRILYEAETETREVLDPRVAYIVTDILSDAVREGTGTGSRASELPGPVAGKTGTTQDGQDAWFAGYTPDVVGLVWIGFDRPQPILARASGGGLAAPVWGRIMTRAWREPPGTRTWPRPDGIVELVVDPATGRAVGPMCPASSGMVVELFLEERAPVEACPERRSIWARFRGFVGSLGPSTPDLIDTPDPSDELLGSERVPLFESRGRSPIPWM